MAAAQMAYVKVVRLTICANYHMSQSCLIEINKSISELRRYLSCVVCCRLLTDPYEPKGPQCGHYVCRLCIYGCKRLVPECPKCLHCCDFKTYEETRVVTLLLICYKSICIYIMLGHIFPQLDGYVPVPHTDLDIPAAKLPSMSTQDVIHEASNYDDIMNTFLYESDLPFFHDKTDIVLESPLREISASLTARTMGKNTLPAMPMTRYLTPEQKVAWNRAIRIVAASAEYVKRHWKENVASNGNGLASTSGENLRQLLPTRINKPAQKTQASVKINGSTAVIQKERSDMSLKVRNQAMIGPNETSLSSSKNQGTKAKMVNPEPMQVSGQGEKADKTVDAQVEMKSQTTNVKAEDLLGPIKTKNSVVTLVNQDIEKNPSSNVKAMVPIQEGKSNKSSIAQEKNKTQKANPVKQTETVVQAPPSRKRKSNETIVSVKDKRKSTDIPLRSVKPIIESCVQVKPPDKPVEDVSLTTVSNQKQRKVCGCGQSVGKKKRNVCRSNRCYCYSNGYSCSDCNCQGCKNPLKPDINPDDEKKEENLPMDDNLGAEKPTPIITPTVDSKSSYESIILVAISNPEESEHPLVLVENENKEMQCFNVLKGNVAIDPIEIGFHRVQLHTTDPKYKAIPKYAYMPFPPQNTMSESSPLSPFLEETSHPVIEN
ncbi:E3 ubiquitin-protein ligase msl-2-like [Drosophila tropicalis]|uniref:E3 ubiquitin-protein ligase msl-2-like n=1 Tax=Drosophila tropicalis TaxID=46794 RepID=UPI0035ABB7C2